MTHQGRTLTYGELRRQAQELARSYRQLGVRPGDRIICQLRGCPEHVVALYAAWLCGALHVGADNDVTGPELSWLVEHTEAAAVLFQAPLRADEPFATLRQVGRDHPDLTLVVHGETTGTGFVRLDDLITPSDADGEPLPDEVAIGVEDPALLLLTSGTTGRPKAVVETLGGFSAKFQFFADAYHPTPDDVHLMYLPVCHAFGLKLTMTALLSGGRLVLLDRFSPGEALRLITEERVSVLPGTPTHYRLLVDALDPAAHDVSSLRSGPAAAAPLSASLLEQVYGEFDLEVMFVYGCTEGFLTVTTGREVIVAGSVGDTVFRGPPGSPQDGSVTIMEPAGLRRAPVGETGEIVFGAAAPVRYWNEPDVATDGWYRTGDLGHLDEWGRLYVSGRLKDLVNRGGLKVAPSEVESRILRHPQVAEAGVVATPDPILGEAVCACIVPADDSPPTLDELRAFLAPDLARHKLPDELCVVKVIPRTKLGKVDRLVLAAAVIDADARQYARRR